jgi:malonyl-CoA O-methyltransferase
LFNLFGTKPAQTPVDEKECVKKAIQWVRNNRIPGSGIRASHKKDAVTPEVTGYLIDSLWRVGEREFAYDLAKWEVSVQMPSGAFGAPDGVPYTFDTAQVIRGFLTLVDDKPEFMGPLRKACDYTEKMIAPDGNVTHESYDMWYLPDGTVLSEYGNLYVLPPMLEAGKKLNEPRYTAAAKRGMEYFRGKPDLVEFKSSLTMLSHYFGYMMEALVDLGEAGLAKKGLKQARAVQRKDGSIPAYPGVRWVCSTGLAQLAIAWYKLGERAPADGAFLAMCRLQNPSGGFYGGYGKGANYFPDEEIPWAVKFFLDAWLLKNKA